MTSRPTRRSASATLAAAVALAARPSFARAPGAPASGAFPQGFVFGVCGSAAQTESRKGRGRSNWDVFADTPGRIRDGSSNARCTEFEARYDEDLALMAGAGVNAFRFSIAWPRVQPDGPGAPSSAGLDLYDRMVDDMLAAGLQPWPTIFHWDTPVWAGDFRNRDIAHRVADYAAIVAARLGDRIRAWVVLNEANVVAANGYLQGSHAPGLHDVSAAAAAIHHQNLAQGLATAALRASLPPDRRIGSAVSLAPVVAVGGAEADAQAARRFKALWSGTILAPMFGRPYPASAADLLAPLIHDGDDRLMAMRPDFLGVNYYARTYVRAGPEPLGFLPAPPPAGTAMTDFFYFEPAGLTEILLQMTAEYGPIPLVVTETGFAERDPPALDGRIDDVARLAHLRAYLGAALDAIAGGVDLRGLFYWAATDNWEWAEGFAKRFGLVAVDPATQARTAKSSLAFYGACARAGALV